MIPRLSLMLFTLALLPAAAFGQADPGVKPKPQRHLAVVLDTSTSMREARNDRPRLAIQAIKILADMLGPDDDLTLAWMPDSPDCVMQPEPGRRLDLQAGDREGFKQALDARATYGGPTNFIVPLLSAKQALEQSRASERLLIVIADAGRDSCRAESNQVLQGLREAGVHTAFVGLGIGGKLPHSEYDIPTTAQTPTELLAAIGLIYQRFLGAKAPDSGELAPGAATIAAKVAPFVREAFLLVAAQGPVGDISADADNPSAAGVELGYRSGETRGRDDLTRGYRIVRLVRPAAGTWRFTVSGLTSAAGWYLIQDFSVSLRVNTPPTAAQGEPVPLTLELIDDSTGQRIPRPEEIPGLAVEALIDGSRYAFRDDGQDGDASADDGVMTARVQFMKSGAATFSVRLASQYLEAEQQQRTQVASAAWKLAILTPPATFIGGTIQVAVQIQPAGVAAALTPPDLVRARLGDNQLQLGDDGRDGDQLAGDGIYARDWIPDQVAALEVTYTPVGGSESAAAQGHLDVKGTIRFGPPGALDLGRLTSRSVGEASLDLRFVEVRGQFDLKVSSDYARGRSVLEVDLGQGFTELNARGLALRIQEGGNQRYPLRLRVNNCPEGVTAGAEPAGRVILETMDQLGQPLRAEIPIRVEIIADAWLHCWWPVIAAILLGLLAVFILYGILSPARFPRNLAVILSPESDMDEGYPFNIRSQKGARSGFYRNARMHITTDFQLRRSANGALARLRADRLGVFIQPLPGNSVLHLDEDNRWEPLSTEQETRVRFSTLYKNPSETLFFEFRNL